MKTFWVGLLRGCRHGSHILERGHFCAPAERPPAVLGETWFLLGSKQGSDSISLDSQNSFFDHKVIVSLAMNKQLFRKVGHLLQPKMSCPPGTGGLKCCVTDTSLSPGRLKTPDECSTHRTIQCTNTMAYCSSSVYLLPSLIQYFITWSRFWTAQDCSKAWLRSTEGHGLGHLLKTEFEHILSQDKFSWVIFS